MSEAVSGDAKKNQTKKNSDGDEPENMKTRFAVPIHSSICIRICICINDPFTFLLVKKMIESK